LIEYSGVIHCPQCNNPTLLQSDGIDGLPSYFVNQSTAEPKKHNTTKHKQVSTKYSSEEDDEYDTESIVSVRIYFGLVVLTSRRTTQMNQIHRILLIFLWMTAN
jgi:hypothetical protein